MYLIKYVKTAIMFLVIAMNISCSTKKEVFLPKDSVYSASIRSIMDTSHSYYDTTYPIILTDKLPFEEAVYRDATELFRLVVRIHAKFYWQQISKEKNKEYFIISCDDKYIYYGFLKEANSELYAKYNPVSEDNQNIRIKNYRKLHYWLIQELNKSSTISIIGDEKETYISKSFGVI